MKEGLMISTWNSLSYLARKDRLMASCCPSYDLLEKWTDFHETWCVTV